MDYEKMWNKLKKYVSGLEDDYWIGDDLSWRHSTISEGYTACQSIRHKMESLEEDKEQRK